MKKIEKLSKDWSYLKKKRKKNNEDCRISEYSHRFKKKKTHWISSIVECRLQDKISNLRMHK